MKLRDITINGWYFAKRDIETSQGVIKKGTRVQAASKQGDDLFVYFNYRGVRVNPKDLEKN